MLQIFGGTHDTRKIASHRPNHRPIRRLTAMVGAIAMGLAWVAIPADYAAADPISLPPSGAYLQITKQAGLLQPDGSCQMGVNLDSAGFLWAPAGTAVCYVITATNLGPQTATGVIIDDSFYSNQVPGNGQPILTSVSTPTSPVAGGHPLKFTVNGVDMSQACDGSVQNGDLRCGRYADPAAPGGAGWGNANVTLPVGASAVMQISGIINPTMPPSFTRDEAIAQAGGGAQCPFQAATNQGSAVSGGTTPGSNLPQTTYPTKTGDTCTGQVWGQSWSPGAWVNNQATVTADNNTNVSDNPATQKKNNVAIQSIGVGNPPTTQTPTPPPPPPSADVRVTKTAPSTVTPGQSITWNVTATNYGPNNADGVVVTDNVPAGVTVTQATGCTPTSGTGPLTLTCNAGSLSANQTAGQAGGAATFSIVATVSSSFSDNLTGGATAGTLSNTASATSTTPDPCTSATAGTTECPTDNNTATTTTSVPIVHDLSIQKTANRSVLTAEAGLPVNYTLSVANSGASAAHQVVVTDVLPSQLLYQGFSYTPSTADVTCDTPEVGSTGTVTCHISSLSADPRHPVLITINTTSSDDLASAGQPIPNTATVVGDGFDPNDANHTNGQACSSAANAPCQPGQSPTNNNSATWTLSGSPVADGYVNKTMAGGAGTPTDPTTANAGEPSTITFDVGVTAGTDGVYVIQPLVTDQLPAGVSIGNPVGATITTTTSANGTNYSLEGGDCTTDPTTILKPEQLANSTLPAGTLYCMLAENMPEGDEAQITVPIKFDSNVTDGSTIVNTAMVQNTSDRFIPGQLNHGVETDQNQQNNTSTVYTTVSATTSLVGSLAVSNAHSPGVDCNGNPTDPTYTGPGSTKQISVNIQNTGTADAANPGFTIQRTTGGLADVSQMRINGILASDLGITPQCTLLVESIVCTLPGYSIEPGQTLNITYPVTTLASDSPGSYPDTLTVVSSTTPTSSVTYQNATSPIVIGQPVTNMCLTKTPAMTTTNPGDGDQGYAAGSNFSYALNIAPPTGGVSAAANNVTVTDLLPVGLVPISAGGGSGASCAIGTPVTGTTTDANGNTATGPQYPITCTFSTPISGNAVAPNERPGATINIFGSVDPEAVNMYYTSNIANGTNWAERVPNVGNLTYTAPNKLVSAGAYCATADAGAVGQNGNGVQYQCTTTDTDSSYRWRRVTGSPIGPILSAPPATTYVDLYQPVPDLSITKTPDQQFADPGAALTWTLTVTNKGPGTAQNVVIADTMNDGAQATITGASIASSSGATGVSCPSGTVPCTAGSLAAGGSVVVTVTGTMNSGIGGGVVSTNTASVKSDSPDGNPADNTAAANSISLPVADLYSNKTAPATANPGGNITWLVTAGNYGPGTVPDAVVADAIPAGVTVTSATWPLADGTTASCATLPLTGPGTLTCSVGTLAANSSVNITVSGTIANTFTGKLTNNANAYSPTIPDMPSGTSNTSSANTQVDATAHLWVKKSGPDSGNVVAGQEIQWVLIAGNDGPSTVSDAVITDNIPAGVTVSSAPGCTPASGVGPLTLTCSVPTLAAGDTTKASPITITATVDPGYTGSLHNTASIKSPTVTDPGKGPGGGSSDTDVAAQTDIWISKTASPGPILAGNQIEWNIVAGNRGPSTAKSVVVTENIPVGVNVISAPGCNPASGAGAFIMTCGPVDIAPNTSVPFKVTAVVDRTYSGTLSNSASVNSPSPSVPTPSGPKTTPPVDTTINPITDLGIGKTASDTAPENGVIEYAITVTNYGPTDVTDATVADSLPAGVDPSSVAITSAPAGCDPFSSCVFPLNVGASETIRFTVNVDGAVAGDHVGPNTASVSSSVAEPDMSNNTAYANTTLIETAVAPPMPAPVTPVSPSVVPPIAIAPSMPPTAPTPPAPPLLPGSPGLIPPVTAPPVIPTTPSVPELPWIPAPAVPSIPGRSLPAASPSDTGPVRNPKSGIHLVSRHRPFNGQLTATGVEATRGWIIGTIAAVVGGAVLTLTGLRRKGSASR